MRDLPRLGGVYAKYKEPYVFLHAQGPCAEVTPTQAQRLTRSVLRLACRQHQRARLAHARLGSRSWRLGNSALCKQLAATLWTLRVM